MSKSTRDKVHFAPLFDVNLAIPLTSKASDNDAKHILKLKNLRHEK